MVGADKGIPDRRMAVPVPHLDMPPVSPKLRRQSGTVNAGKATGWRSQEMTVSNYADLMKAIDPCRNAVMGAPPENLSPQPVAVNLPPPPPPPGSPSHWPFHIHHRQDDAEPS